MAEVGIIFVEIGRIFQLSDLLLHYEKVVNERKTIIEVCAAGLINYLISKAD